MSPGARDDTIPAELEQSCAEEPIHLLGTVQAYGFLMVVDVALYQAKSMGRGRSVVFELVMASNQRDYYLLERDLDEAVERNQLALVFQPKVDLISRKVVGLEARVRWNHPTRGQNSPGAFIPIAEHSDQIVRIDRWVR